MCWWNVIRIYFNVHIFTNIFFELGNYSIRSLGTPLLNAAVYDATKKIPNPDQEDATTKTVFDKWLSSFPNVNDNLPRYFLSRQLLTQSLKFFICGSQDLNVRYLSFAFQNFWHGFWKRLRTVYQTSWPTMSWYTVHIQLGEMFSDF